jgi:hypothetical protein
LRAWPGRGWTWDGRFGAFASTFGAPVEAQARAALSLALPGQWTSATLPQAPEALRAICAASGGLRADQLLFGGKTKDGVTPYGLWWPWSGGQTLTLRLGFHGADSAAMAKLRQLFAVPG